jgi:Holliday junction resolvasome RuvABC DNA-binding subunit
LIVEMRDRIAATAGDGVAIVDAPRGGAEAEAFTALVALGYKPAEATKLVKSAGGARGHLHRRLDSSCAAVRGACVGRCEVQR